MAFLELKNVSKGFGTGPDRVEVLKDINLAAEEGEFIAIVGFTGSGKTTLINMIAGLSVPDTGEVLINGEPVKGPGQDRGVVFQNYSILPWLTVYQNVALAVSEVFPKMGKHEKKAYCTEYIEMVSLGHAMDKRPAELSGGMRQRVSVARTLAMNPNVLLLDEPLSALDALTRGSLQKEIENIWRRDKKTAILITNDVDEGLLMADRIIPLKPGPNATLGPSFKVDLERPRDKTALNRDPAFIKLRNEVTNYLMDVGQARASGSTGEAFVLPDLEPKDLLQGRTLAWSYNKGHGKKSKERA